MKTVGGISRVADIGSAPFRVVRYTIAGVLKLGRSIYQCDESGRISMVGYVDLDKEGINDAIDDRAFGVPADGALVMAVDQAEFIARQL